MISTTAKFRVESGVQLLARLTSKPNIENFYPVLFNGGPKHGEVIELFSSAPESTSSLLSDIVSEVLIPMKSDGIDAGVLYFNTDGNFSFEILKNYLLRKLTKRNLSTVQECDKEAELSNLLHEALCNFYIVEIHDATQFYSTIHNLDNILVEHPNISLIIFDTLTAFYWSEQGFKITKMDIYVKYLLQMIQKVTKEYKVSILYTRPEYFISNKEPLDKLEACCELPTLERLNYRIQLLCGVDEIYIVNVKTFDTMFKRLCNIFEDEVKWL